MTQAIALALTLVSVLSQQHPLRDHELLDRFFAPDEQPLVSYRALRRMTASTRGGRMSATIEAWTSLDPVRGFTFEIVSEEGSAIIRKRVLLAALEAEQAVTAQERQQSALTRGNYEFLATEPATDSLVRVGVRPRRKHMMLVDGSLYLNDETADLVRVEGELSQRPSFWTRRVRVVREYDRIGGIHVPVSMKSTADVLVVGSSSFAMTYRYTEINGKNVERP